MSRAFVNEDAAGGPEPGEPLRVLRGMLWLKDRPEWWEALHPAGK